MVADTLIPASVNHFRAYRLGNRYNGCQSRPTRNGKQSKIGLVFTEADTARVSRRLDIY
jgi:hypothetical protein